MDCVLGNERSFFVWSVSGLLLRRRAGKETQMRMLATWWTDWDPGRVLAGMVGKGMVVVRRSRG